MAYFLDDGAGDGRASAPLGEAAETRPPFGVIALPAEEALVQVLQRPQHLVSQHQTRVVALARIGDGEAPYAAGIRHGPGL
jgi:hypothetical protein